MAFVIPTFPNYTIEKAVTHLLAPYWLKNSNTWYTYSSATCPSLCCPPSSNSSYISLDNRKNMDASSLSPLLLSCISCQSRGFKWLGRRFSRGWCPLPGLLLRVLSSGCSMFGCLCLDTWGLGFLKLIRSFESHSVGFESSFKAD